MFRKSLAILLSALLLSAAGVTAQTGVSVTDFEGRIITLAKKAERIVALMPADVEILYAIGAQEVLIARGEYCNYPKEALEKDVVKSGQEMNLEQIIAFAPDVVVSSKMSHSVQQVEALEKAGIQVVISNAQDLSGVYAAIEMLGTLTARETQAAALIEDMHSHIVEIEKKVNGKTAGTVYYEASPLQYGLWAAGGGTFMDELGRIVGLENIFGQSEGWPQVSEEQVIAKDPTYVVTTTMFFGDGPTPIEEIYARAGWQDMQALKNNKVLNADSDAITRPGPRLIQAAGELYEFVWGDSANAK
ncbi:MAG: ABC transporter substrate-binding protein [Eubacteriales bacterium]|nr:ABC transporter substrate-binding protein [Eubacteriales bacterium]